MTEQVTTIFDSDWAETEQELVASVVDGKKLIYGIGEAVQQLYRAKVKKRDILILMPKRAIANIRMAAPLMLEQGRSHMKLFGCRVGINKQSDRIFVGQEVKV